jgi:hypothetical protein
MIEILSTGEKFIALTACNRLRRALALLSTTFNHN